MFAYQQEACLKACSKSIGEELVFFFFFSCFNLNLRYVKPAGASLFHGVSVC